MSRLINILENGRQIVLDGAGRQLTKTIAVTYSNLNVIFGHLPIKTLL